MTTKNLQHVAVYNKRVDMTDNRDPYSYTGMLHCFVPVDDSVAAVVELDDGSFRAVNISQIKALGW